MKKWIPVLEADTDNGQHTCYARHFSGAKYIWLTQSPGGCWNVEVRSEVGSDFITIAKSKTLCGAKQRALRYIKEANC